MDTSHTPFAGEPPAIAVELMDALKASLDRAKKNRSETDERFARVRQQEPASEETA